MGGRIYPSNKKHFIGLVRFGSRIISIFNEIGIKYQIYGSLAYFFYTKKKNVKVKDIDILIGEKDFTRIMKIFDKKGIKYKYSKKWHAISVRRGKLLIEIDSRQFWFPNLSEKSKNIQLNGFKIKIVNLMNLIQIYKTGFKTNKKKWGEYTKKYNALRKLKK